MWVHCTSTILRFNIFEDVKPKLKLSRPAGSKMKQPRWGQLRNVWVSWVGDRWVWRNVEWWTTGENKLRERRAPVPLDPHQYHSKLTGTAIVSTVICQPSSHMNYDIPSFAILPPRWQYPQQHKFCHLKENIGNKRMWQITSYLPRRWQ
jgi:hypothetical protein